MNCCDASTSGSQCAEATGDAIVKYAFSCHAGCANIDREADDRVKQAFFSRWCVFFSALLPCLSPADIIIASKVQIR